MIRTQDVHTHQDALARLKEGNARHLAGEKAPVVTDEVRQEMIATGQHPYACIVTCSDSRVIPEDIFCAGPGELFIIRTAGNTISASELATVAYAGHHLHVPLAVVMGHTHCGAIEAVLAGHFEENIKHILEKIQKAIAGETDPRACEIINAKYWAEQVVQTGEFAQLPGRGEKRVVAALYEMETGRVIFQE